MNFPFVLNLTSLMAHAAKEAREAVAERKSGKINFLGATQSAFEGLHLGVRLTFIS